MIRARSPVSCLLLCALLGAGAASAADGDPALVLMGYERIAADGLPLGVQVALTRQRLETLWRAAEPRPAIAAPVCDLASGAPDYRLEFTPHGTGAMLEVVMRLPLAVLAEGWRQVRLPVLPGTVRAVAGEPLGDGKARRLAWRLEGEALVVDLEGLQQTVLVVRMGLTMTAEGGGFTGALPLLAGHGARLALHGPVGWQPQAEGVALAQAAGADAWTADGPATGERLVVRWRRPEARAPDDLHLGFDQRVVLALAPGRLEWQAEWLISAQGGSLREVRLALPPGLALTSVEGEGLAAWRQDGAEAALAWSSPRTDLIRVQATGVMPRAAGGAARAEVAARLLGAERSRGRIGLRAAGDGEGERFVRPAHAALERTDPAAGEDAAALWSDHPEALAVAWERQPVDLRVGLQAALVVGRDRARLTAVFAVSGRGRSDALRVGLPAPWRVVGTGPVLHAFEQGAPGAPRRLVLRGSEPFAAGALVVLEAEAERRELEAAAAGAPWAVPDLALAGEPGVTLERQAWLLGDANDRRLRITDLRGATDLAPEPLAAALARHGVALGGGERWRQACESRGALPPLVDLVAERPQVRVTASHYLVLGPDRVRWSARLVFDPDQGELAELRCTLPPGALLTRLNARDLGEWRRDGNEVVARLAAPAQQPVALDLELEMPLSEAAGGATASVSLPAIGTAPGQPLVAQQVALVEDDDLGLVHRTLHGLEPRPELAMVLPDGVDAAEVRQRWTALRPDWRLDLAREPLVAAGGVDAVASLVDAVSVIAPDGEMRGRSTWHVLNRSRQQLPLTVPDGVELWEARVGGRLVRARIDAGQRAVVWVPVRPLRAGEAALRIDLTWRQRAGEADDRLSPRMPVFAELRLMQVLWRFVPPPGARVVRRDGTLDPAVPGDAEAARARRVIDELQRLGKQGELKDAALERCNAQLAALDVELNDYLVGLRNLGSQSLESAAADARGVAQQRAQQQVIEEVALNRVQLQQSFQDNEGKLGSRAGRRKALGLYNLVQTWDQVPGAGRAPAAPMREAGFHPRRQPLVLPWREALAVEAGAGLGAGEAPAGYRGASDGSLLGLDLVGDAPGVGLTLRGQGSDLSIELGLERDGTPWRPWALLALALLAAFAGLRRRG